MPDLTELSAVEIAALVRARAVSPLEVVEASLVRIAALDPAINAFSQIDPERARAEASAQGDRIVRGDDLGPLCGVPIGVKELENVTGFRSTSASRAFADRVPAADDVHVARLRAAGAIVIGKTNAPEFGYTSFTTNELFGTTRNPWDRERTPGGSSGGSAAAVVAGMVPLATGSDAGGSIRIPAAFSGCFGFKPTFGLIPTGTQGLLGWNDLSHYGPISHTVADAALFLDVTAGYHPADPNSRPKPSSFMAAIETPLRPLKALFLPTMGLGNVQPDVARAVQSTVEAFAALGHEVVEKDAPLESVFGPWLTVTRLQALASMRELIAAKPDEVSATYRGYVDLGNEVTALELRDAYAARTRLNRWLAGVLSEYDLLLTPTMPLEAFASEGPIPTVDASDPHGGWVITFTAPFNLSGHPAASVPAGFTDAGLPAGLQIVAERHKDSVVLQAAKALEEARPWPRWRPETPAT